MPEHDAPALAATILHNPRCGTSRTVLALLREAGVEPEIVDYLATPPDCALLSRLLAEAGLRPIDAVRAKDAALAGLDLEGAGDDAVLEAMLAHPEVIQRPFVVTPLGTRLCRPAERVHEILSPRRRDP